MNFFLSFLKNPKIILILTALVLSTGVIWYGVNLIQDKGALEEQLRQKEEQIVNIQSTLEEEREQFQTTISNYDEIMSEYVNQLADNQQSSQRLRQTISRLSQENDRLGQCLREPVPQELIDQLWEGQQ